MLTGWLKHDPAGVEEPQQDCLRRWPHSKLKDVMTSEFLDEIMIAIILGKAVDGWMDAISFFDMLTLRPYMTNSTAASRSKVKLSIIRDNLVQE